jgi:1-deoxy-D-xylulose-5-phosphate synthase
MAPKDENELQHMLYTGTLINGPVAIRYPRGSGLGVTLDNEFQQLPIGKAEILQNGKDLTLIAVGSMVDTALKAAQMLNERGITCTVINARFIKPLDTETILGAICNCNGVVTLEENILDGGFGSAIVEIMAAEGLKQKVLRIGLEDFSTHGNINILKEVYGLSPEKVLQRIEEEFTFKDLHKLKKLAINLMGRNK